MADAKSFNTDATAFATTAVQKTNVSPLASQGFAAPTQPPSTSSDSAASIAMKNAQFKLQAAQHQLDAARASSEKATEKLMSVTKDLGEVLGSGVDDVCALLLSLSSGTVSGIVVTVLSSDGFNRS